MKKHSVKSKKLKVVKVYLALYKSDFILLIGEYKDVLPWAKRALLPWKYESLVKHSYKEEDKSLEGRTWDMGGGGSLIWMPSWNATVLSHEIIHAAMNCFNAKDTPVNRDTEELFAYLVGYLHAQLHN